MIDNLFIHETPLTGNLAKVQVLERMMSLLEKTRQKLRMLDVGCGNLNLWYGSSIIPKYAHKLSLHCIDVGFKGINEANSVIKRQKWDNVVKTQLLSVYELSKVFKEESFDVVVSTQVLEHLKHIKRALTEIHRVLKPRGLAFFTLDSAHYRRRENLLRKAIRERFVFSLEMRNIMLGLSVKRK